MPLSSLRWTGTPSGISRIGDRELQAGLPRVRDLTVRAGRPEDEDALDAELMPECEPFGNRRDAERRRPGAQRSTRRINRSVPVPVRLHDDPELRAVQRAEQRPHVAPQRAQVDGDLGAVHLSLPQCLR